MYIIKKLSNIGVKVLHRYIYPIFMYAFPINPKKIVFSSYGGKQYSDNPRAISEQLNNTYPNEYKIVWIVNKPLDYREKFVGITFVKSESISAAYHLYTAKVWVDNIRKSLKFPKKKTNTLYTNMARHTIKED